MSQNARPTILLVEDSLGDAWLTQEAFRRVNDFIDLKVVIDGVDGMAYLRREGHYADAPRPDLVLLDLNLPKMDGREVLAHIKADDNLKQIPTIILTTSQTEEDIVNSYQLQANCYVTKPVQLEDFQILAANINRFWLSTSKSLKTDQIA
jgi:chemotaxis family two-component system response regulator Rcp1